jgi:hypothetical protein
MSITFKIIRNGSNFFCTADDGLRFFVGRQVKYKQRIGLYNVFAGSPIPKSRYAAADFAGHFGFWAEFIDPTAECEGRSFLTLNTYDRAAFTFGFAQFAAHVPDGDFVKYFRAMLRLPNASSYFPTLEIDNGRITRDDGPTPAPLETSGSTDPLMHYLNPSPNGVEDEEVIAAARFIHWTISDPAARALQTDGTVATFRSYMAQADRRGLINGRTADLCCVVGDIIHQGRGTWAEIGHAIKSSNPFDNLIAIGSPEYDGRKRTLRRMIRSNPNMTGKTWDSASADFV